MQRAQSWSLVVLEKGRRRGRGCDGDALVCPAAKIFCSWSRGFKAPWGVILSVLVGHRHNKQGGEDRPCLAQGVQTPSNFTNADLLFNF